MKALIATALRWNGRVGSQAPIGAGPVSQDAPSRATKECDCCGVERRPNVMHRRRLCDFRSGSNCI